MDTDFGLCVPTRGHRLWSGVSVTMFTRRNYVLFDDDVRLNVLICRAGIDVLFLNWSTYICIHLFTLQTWCAFYSMSFTSWQNAPKHLPARCFACELAEHGLHNICIYISSVFTRHVIMITMFVVITLLTSVRLVLSGKHREWTGCTKSFEDWSGTDWVCGPGLQSWQDPPVTVERLGTADWIYS